MNKKTYLALIKLREPIYCACGVQLVIKKVMDVRGQFILLQADEIGEIIMETKRVVYDMKTNEVLSPGSFDTRSLFTYWPPGGARK